MRNHWIVTLLAVAIFAAGNAAVATTAVGHQVLSSSTRKLRAHTEVGDERANSPSLSVYENLARALPKLLQDDEITVLAGKALAKKTSSSDVVFLMLGLDKGLPGILSNPNLKQFAYYLELTEKAPTQTLVTKLANQYGDDVLAKYHFDIKHHAINVNKGVKDEAASLQVAQFIKWIYEGVTPSKVREKLDVRPETWSRNPYEGVYDEFTRGYIAIRSKSRSPVAI